MKKNPFISVIIATYNRKQTLEKTINSLIVQDYPQEKYEIIAVDDGSTDGTEDLIKNLNNLRPVRYFKQEHKKSAAARNLGIKNSKGEIISFLDSDCIAGQNWLSIMARLYQQHPEVVAVGGGCRHNVTGRGIFYHLTELLSYTPGFDKEHYVNELPTRNLSFKKEVFDRNGFFDEALGYPGEDKDFNLRLAARGFKIYYSPELTVTHNHPFNFISFYKREFAYGQSFYRLYSRWPDVYMPHYRLPLNIKDSIIFWLGSFYYSWLRVIALTPGKKVRFLPLLILQQFIYRIGIFYEMKK